MTNPTPQVTVYTLTFNEARQIRDVLESIKWADEIILVDSFSTDGTVEIAREYGARILSEKFHGFGALRNKALAAAKFDWIVSIDADERSTPEFAAEVRQTVAAPSHPAYFVPRRNYFLDRPIRFCGMYPDYRQPQVFDRRRFRYRAELVHEGFDCDGQVGHFNHPIDQHPLPTLSVVMAKTERYTSLMAQRYYEAGRRAGLAQMAFNPPAAFLKKYLLQQGFREGMHGFLFASLHGWYTFLKYAKLWEYQRHPPPAPAPHG
ncbi:MAG: glycosyltransferase family 2 protein [Verrucomicrobia bacterium]|nr:glycosyltransferase family 2 protein [Verrucomicrobiota bacterium]